MADIQYLNYGDLQIELLALLNKLANLVQDYVAKLPWSNSRKEKFMSAYTDIMNHGINGASNTDGQWKISVGGTPLDLSTKSKKDLEMYSEAAYFIQQLMASLPTKVTLQEEKKSNLPVFSNEQFISDLSKAISNGEFGGQRWDTKTLWNSLDARDKSGKRGRTERSKILANYLENYSNSLTEDKYDFKESPFGSLEEFKTRISNAVNALRDNDITNDLGVLNKIGLNESDWFNDGTGDPSGKYITLDDGTLQELSYAQLANYTKLQQAVLQPKQTNKTFSGTRRYDISKLSGKPMTLESMNTISSKLSTFQKLTPDEISLITWAFKNSGINLENLSQEEFSRMPAQYRKAGRLKKISELPGIYYDTIGGGLVLPYNEDQQSGLSLLDVIYQNSPEALHLKKAEEQENYLNNTNWTSDLWRELGGIAADVASVIDPEPFSAGGLALTGTGLRTWNRAFDKDGFTWSDAGHTALDAGLSLLGMIPVVGDAALAARVVGKLLKAAGWMGAIFAASSVPLAAKAAWNKVVNGLDMTVDDWRAIGNVLMGATLARRIHLNRAAGNAVKNSKSGSKKENFGEVEIKIDGKTEKIELSESEAKELQAAYKKAGNNLEETSKALRNSRAVREKLESKKNSDGTPMYSKELLDAIEAPLAALGNIRGRVPVLSRDKDIRGIKIGNRIIQTEGISIPENAPLRVQYMLNNKGLFKRGDFGWNLRTKGSEPETKGWFRRKWDELVNPYNFKSKETINPTEDNSFKNLILSTPELKNAFNPPTRKTSRSTPMISERNNNVTSKLIDGSEFKATFDPKTEVITVEFDGLKIPMSGNGLHQQKIAFGKWIQELNTKILLNLGLTLKENDPKWLSLVKAVRELKRKGYLFKQGGRITDSQIDKFLKQYK